MKVEGEDECARCTTCNTVQFLVEGEDESAQCTTCNTVQFLDEAKHLLAATFTLKTTSEERIHVRAYGTCFARHVGDQRRAQR